MPNHALIPRRPEYYVQTGSMFENPHGVPHDEIVSMILEQTPEVSAQVVFGKYVESSGLVFTGELIQMMIDRERERVLGDRYVDADALEMATAMIRQGTGHGLPFHTGVDFARQTDYTVISTIDTRYRPARLVYYRRLNRVPWETIYTEVGRARMMWGTSILGDDTGPGGDVVFDSLESRWYCPEHDRCNLIPNRCQNAEGSWLGCKTKTYLPLSCVEGYTFSGPSKKQLIEHLRNVLSVGYRPDLEPGQGFGWLRVPPIVQLEEELTFYLWDDKGLETDCLMSLALAAWQGLEDVPGNIVVGSPWGV